MQRTAGPTTASDDEALAQALQRAETEATELQGQIDAWKRADEAACVALTLELASAGREAEALAALRQATRDRIAKMTRERRALLSWRGVTWKGVQLVVRLLLLLSAAIAFLMFTTNDELSGWPIFGVLLSDLALVWFLGDLADYLELSHG